GAVLVRRLRPLQRRDREIILGFSREDVFLRAVLREGAHQAALVVGILEAVVEHVVDHLAVPHAQAGAGLRQEVGCVGHGFHAAGDDDYILVAEDVVREHRRLHSRAAHLVDGRAAGGERQAGAKRSLACRRLALPRGKNAAHQHFLHVPGTDLRALHGGADCRSAELGRGEPFEFTLERAHRRARGGDDDDRIGLHGYSLMNVADLRSASIASFSRISINSTAGRARDIAVPCPAPIATKSGFPALPAAWRNGPVSLFCAGYASCGARSISFMKRLTSPRAGLPENFSVTRVSSSRAARRESL